MGEHDNQFDGWWLSDFGKLGEELFEKRFCNSYKIPAVQRKHVHLWSLRPVHFSSVRGVHCKFSDVLYVVFRTQLFAALSVDTCT